MEKFHISQLLRKLLTIIYTKIKNNFNPIWSWTTTNQFFISWRIILIQRHTSQVRFSLDDPWMFEIVERNMSNTNVRDMSQNICRCGSICTASVTCDISAPAMIGMPFSVRRRCFFRGEIDLRLRLISLKLNIFNFPYCVAWKPFWK